MSSGDSDFGNQRAREHGEVPLQAAPGGFLVLCHRSRASLSAAFPGQP